jgi:hypothetical protein
MGRCIATETGRVRRALHKPAGPRAITRKDPVKGSRARRVNRVRSGVWWSFPAWLWTKIKETVAGAHGRMEGQTTIPVPSENLTPIKGSEN